MAVKKKMKQVVKKTVRKAAKMARPAKAAVAKKGSANGAKGTDPKRVAAILAKLDEAYPDATCELKHENAFQLLIRRFFPRNARTCA